MSLPPIGSPERDALESLAIEFADERLSHLESMKGALTSTLSELMRDLTFDDANEVIRHVEQVWIGRILHG